MPRYPKSKFQLLSPSKQQSLQKAGVTIYDDSGGAGGSEHRTHEDSFGELSTNVNPKHVGPPPAMNLPATVGNAEKEEFSDSYRKYTDWLKKSRREVAGMAAGIATSEFTAPVLGAMAGSVAAGKALKHAPKAIRLGAKWLARPAGEAVGQGAGEYANQVIAGTKEPKRVGLQAAIGGGLSMGLQAAIPVIGRASGLDPEVALAPVGDPRFARKLPGRGKPEVDLTREINSRVANMPKTAARGRLEGMIDSYDRSGSLVDGDLILQDIAAAKSWDATPEAIAANQALDRDIDIIRRKMDRITGGTRKLTAEQADEIIRTSLTRPAEAELQGKTGGTLHSNLRAEGRNYAAQNLYGNLGPGAAEAGAEAHQALLAKEGLQDMFPVDKRGNPRLSSPGRVASVGAEGNMSAELVLQSLRDFDRFNPGANLEQKVLDLAFSRAWGPQKQRTASYIMSMLKMPGASGGASGAQNFIRMLGRMAIRSQGVSGAAARGAAGQMTVDLTEPSE